MNEIDLNAIHRLEYYIEIIKNNIWVRLIGFILFVASLGLGYALYMGMLPVPSSIPFLPYSKYIAAGVIGFIGLMMMFTRRKTLYLNINAGNSDKTVVKFDVNKYNELAIRYLASKIRPN